MEKNIILQNLNFTEFFTQKNCKQNFAVFSGYILGCSHISIGSATNTT